MAGIEIADGGVHPGSKAAVSRLVGQGGAGAAATSALEYMGAVFGLKGLDFGNLKDLMSKRFGWFFVYGTIVIVQPPPQYDFLLAFVCQIAYLWAYGNDPCSQRPCRWHG